jgi:hypothetical protein
LIEPNFNRLALLDRTQPEYCGNRPGTRPENLNALMRQHESWIEGKRERSPFRTIGQIAELYSLALRSLNEQPLQGEGMRKVTPSGYGYMCPNEAWEILIPQIPRRSVSAEILQLCFVKRRELTVHNGEVAITLDGRKYRYRMADNSLRLLMLNDHKVELAYDPLDMGEASIYHNREFFGLARCLELRRMGEDAFVQDERDRRAARRELKRQIAAVHTVPVPTPEMRLQRRAIPERAEPERAEIPVEPPASIAAAAAARRAFDSFDPATVPKMPVLSAYPEDDDCRFDFWGDQK